MKILNNWKLIVLLCLSLGLAPYFSEPHIIGKIRWISGGGRGMRFLDWFDLFLHGFPFILLIRIIYIKLLSKK